MSLQVLLLVPSRRNTRQVPFPMVVVALQPRGRRCQRAMYVRQSIFTVSVKVTCQPSSHRVAEVPTTPDARARPLTFSFLLIDLQNRTIRSNPECPAGAIRS
jgi:hypothetical protein